MLKLCLAAFMVIVNFILYFVFGSLITGRLKNRPFSATISVITGFFLYYCLFEAVCLPVMLTYRPLSLLSSLWVGVLGVVCLLSVFLNYRIWGRKFAELSQWVREHPVFTVAVCFMVLFEAVVIIHAYQFTLDAAYYVATASTALETNMLNVYDPYTGMWQDHFEMRYFFQCYPLQDAVMCRLTGLHPLIWTKTVMEAVSVILMNTAAYRVGRRLFQERTDRVGLFLFFTGLLQFFFTTIYTSAAFFTTRTYEGKTLLGSFVLPVILWIYLELLEDHRAVRYWGLLFLTALGAAVLTNSANMLIPAAAGIFGLSLFLVKKDLKILLRSALCMLPGICLMLVYVAYVHGKFVIYTYPR